MTKEILSNEIERVLAARPVPLNIYGRKLSNALQRTWMANFVLAPRPGFRLFAKLGLGK